MSTKIIQKSEVCKMVTKWYLAICIILLYNGTEVITLTEKIQINLRLQKETIIKLKKEAQKQKRSVNNLIEVIIDEYLSKKDC